MSRGAGTGSAVCRGWRCSWLLGERVRGGGAVCPPRGRGISRLIPAR